MKNIYFHVRFGALNVELEMRIQLMILFKY